MHENMEVQLYVLFEMHDQGLNSSIQFENIMSSHLDASYHDS